MGSQRRARRRLFLFLVAKCFMTLLSERALPRPCTLFRMTMTVHRGR